MTSWARSSSQTRGRSSTCPRMSVSSPKGAGSPRLRGQMNSSPTSQRPPRRPSEASSLSSTKSRGSAHHSWSAWQKRGRCILEEEMNPSLLREDAP
eukprot:1760969-Pyramimonas_sp.AAC.1